MPLYETMLITSAALDAEATAAVVGKFKSLIEANGTIDAVEDWGKRRLAYPINKQEDGVYTLIHFQSDANFPAELDRVYKITDGVLRSLIIVKDEVMEAARLETVKKAEAAKAEAAKAEAARAAARAAAMKEAAEAKAVETAKAEEAPAKEDKEEPKAEQPAQEVKAEEPEAEQANAASEAVGQEVEQ